MKLIRNTSTDANRKFWSSIEKISTEVNKWPGWMRGESIQATATSTTKPHNKPGKITKR